MLRPRSSAEHSYAVRSLKSERRASILGRESVQTLGEGEEFDYVSSATEVCTFVSEISYLYSSELAGTAVIPFCEHISHVLVKRAKQARSNVVAPA